MPDYDGASRTIEQFFETNFTFLAATMVRYQNVPWNPSKTALTEWVELFILHGGAVPTSIGNIASGGGLKDRYAGVVMGHIYTPENTGTRRALQIAEAFCAVFNNKTTSGIRFRSPNINSDAESPNLGFDRVVARVNFERDETT